MNKNKLLELEKCSNSSLSEIQKKQGNLYSQLKQKAENQIKGSINNAFKNGSEELRRSVQSIDFDIEPDEQLDIKSKILRQLKTGKISKEVIHEAVTLLKGLTLPKTLDETLRPDIPIYQNPLFSSELEKARFYRVSDVAGLSDEEAKAVIEKRGTVTALNDKALDLLVKAGDIEKEKAKELGLVADLYRLVDGNIALTDAIKTGSFSQLRVGRVREIKDLVALERNDWLDLLNQSETDPPREMTREAYATLLRKKVETLFPGDALFGKLVPSDTEPLIESIKTLQPFYKTKDNIFSADDFTQENIMGDKFRDAYTRLKQFSNAFPGLKIAEILDEKNVLPSKKIENIEKRITILKDFLDKNSELNLLELDYTPDSKDIERLNFGGMPVEQQKMALSTVKAYQRIYTTTKDTEHTRHLIEASYDSAARIANDSLITFLDRSGLDSKRGERYYYSALNAADKTSNALESVADILRGGFNWFNVANINPSIEGYLKKIDGFEDLFESLDYCQCKHCQSIFGPAAYFVDLMCFTETHILKENFINPGKEDHVLYLKNRRPDLWDLELTCENTNELTPYLVIINEILENYIAKQRGNIANLSDRTAVEDEVYKHTLQNAERSFQLPFLLPLDKLHIYLSHFEKTPGNVAVILEEQSTIVSAASLKLSNGSYRLITRANTTPAFLGRLYGISFQVQANKIKPFDAQLLLTPMELNRAQLGELIQTDFVTGGIADKIQIMGEKTDQNSVQNDIERIYGLTYDVLDRMHRFTRLWRHVNWHIPELESNRWHYDWSIVELDIVLADLEDAHLAQGINEDALRHLTTLLKIQERFQLSVEELSSLWGQIPRKPVTKSNLSLFDRLFNIPDFVLLDGTYPQNATTFVHPSFQPANPPVAQADKALHRLMAGLRVSDEDLHLLIRNLGGPQALNLQNNGFTMTAQHLSLLYRHARLAEFLNLKIPELFHLIKLDQSIADNHISGLDDLVALLRFYDWWDSTEYELDDLGIITGGQVQDIDAYPVKDEIAKQIVVEVEKENALTFADTIFTYFDEITEEQSRKLITGNQAVIVQATNSDSNYWLSQDYDPNVQLNIPADVNLKRPEAELRKHLLNYHATNVIPNYLARKLDLSVEKTIELIGLVGADLSDQELVKELHRITDPPAKLTDLVEKVLPLSILFKNDVLNKDSLSFIRAENALFGNINFTGIEIQDIRRVTLYRNLLSAYLLGANEEVEKKEDENNKRRASIHKVILDYHANNKFSQDSEVIVGKIFGVDSGLIRTLQNQISLPSTLLEAIEKLGRCIALAKELCVGGDALKLIVSQDYDKLAQASDMILSAFRAKYKDEKEWQEKIGPFNNKILTLKRDALVAYLMSSLHPEFETTNDLYNHFLIDVELRGCARTSRVVAAISSLQVYVHRCLMNLEQDNNPGAADRVHVFPEQVPQDEWDWRKNYRVWEANRKVFLYPENYIEPELRDNKTPLFEELEAELLQQEVNEQTVLDAYAKYMRGFEEVANLKIAGSYHDKDWSDETDVLHLFGVTAKEPPIYYYRTVENAHYGEINEDAEIIWSPWRKIEVQIPVRKVAPIVFRGRLHVFWVEITTSPQNEVKSGESKFVGYKHKMSLKYTTLRLDGTWTVPQNVLLPVLWFHQDNGVVPDIFEEGQQYPRRRRYNDTRTHNEPIDSYTLDGFMWDRLYPDKGLKGEKIIVYCAGFELQFGVDFYNNEGTISSPTKDQEYLESKLLYLANLDINEDEVEKPVLLSGSLPIQFTPAGDYALLSILLEESRIVEFQYSYSQRGPAVMRLLSNNVEGIKNDNTPIAELNATDKLFLINGSLNDCIIDSNGDLLLLQGSVRDGTGYVLKRLGTTLSEEVSRKLFTGGIAALLNINSQKTLKEYDLPITPNETYIENKSSESPIDFSGPYGVYYQELLFHIPFLIANHLNSQQKFQEAQKWYHYLFNPTFSDKDDLQVGLSLKEIKVIEQDWKWQYVGFRNLGIETLRDQLENTTAIGTYKKDPFNPHAIARLRLNAYQKSIVMKYIDNLLDWGDRLFARDTMESINEATMLYTLAADILGKRPAELGECSEGEVKPKTYKKIKPLIEKDSEFLVEMEHFVWGRQNRTNSANPVYSHRYTIEPSLIETASSTAIRNLSTNKNKYSGEPIFKGMDWKRNYTAGWLYTNEFRVTEDSDTPIYSAMRIGTHGSWSVKPTTAVPAFVLSLVTQSSPIFCIPENKDLRRYWDRVEDRLYKIHHCMNISGDRRQLALFAPEIDPGLLVRTRAAGLSIEDVLNAINGDLPPYRFSYIIERA